VSRWLRRRDWLNKIICGDCLAILPQLPDECIDIIATDSPYGIGIFNEGWDKSVPSVQVWKECFRVSKLGAFGFFMSSARQDVLAQMIVNLQSAGFIMRQTSLYWLYHTGFSKAYNISKAIDRRLGVKQDVIGTKMQGGPKFRIAQKKVDNGGFNDPKRTSYEITKPTSELAKAYAGAYSNYSPKPSLEVTLVTMKPKSERTSIDQVLANGKGATWLSDCVIPCEGHSRLAADVLVSDDALGEASRYYSLDAWWNELELPENVRKALPFLDVPKPGKAERNTGLKKSEQFGHITQKPVKLFSYILTLASRPGDILLDPYVGSGTSTVAAKILHRNYVGIDINPEYCARARRRLRALSKF
jgi:site-specific DNA-methyltransferase (adenine-specific)